MKNEKTITILTQQGNKQLIDCTENETILEAMLRHGLHYRADCGGRGTCGKCRVQVIEGVADITVQDRRKFSEEELQQGLRLSCKAYLKESCTIALISEEETEFLVVSDNMLDQLELSNQLVAEASYNIAIDLGTTTLAIGLLESNSTKVIRTYTAMNPQRVYGADVVARMKASEEGKRELLRDIIRKELFEGIRYLTTEEGIGLDRISKIIIAGNTTMGHLLMGYSCETLGVYPFTSVEIGTIVTDLHSMFSETLPVPVIILPGISTFVGGDIVSGLFSCGFHQTDKPCLLIDLGTNGEMAIGNKEEILVTSTAAGPAFEGGNISCGIGSIPGAISQVTIGEKGIAFETIGGKPPIGICGTGVIELVSELYRTGIMDETGLLIEPYFESGYEFAGVTFIQKDIRELQLAKAAVRAGVETLVNRYGITYEQIDKVYLAGGFGFKMDQKKAVHIGLLPEELLGKIEAVGNSSLAGAVKYLTDDQAKQSIDQIISVAKEIHLSNDPNFYDMYINYMSFDSDTCNFESR